MLNKNRVTRNLASIALLAGCLLVWPAHLISQTKINSPYSMIGPGEIKGNEYFRNLGMGGISQGFRSNTSVNYLNPASYTAMDSLSFVFDGTVFSHVYQQKFSGQQQRVLYSNLGSLNFAFPVTHRWSIAAGLLPWSQIGYKISDFQQNDIDGRINYLYEGNGGINQVYLGNAFKLGAGLSAGINVSYLFGRIDNKRIAYSDSVGFYRTAWSYSDEPGGVMLTYGLQWQIKLSEISNITLGASYTGLTSLDVNQNRYIYRTLASAGGSDTLNVSPDNKGTMEIPANIAGGVFMTFNPQWSAGLDFQTQKWSEYTSFGQSYGLNDSYQVKFGAAFNPRVETYSGFLNRIEYRGGLRYGKSYLNMEDAAGVNHDFTELGISFGIALPIRRSLSALNLGFEYSQRNSGSTDHISEDFFRFNLGINIYERWFVKRKFY